MKQAVVYCRVSTARQASEGVSLDAQKLACEELCQRNKWPIAGVFIEEGISGRNADTRVCELTGPSDDGAEALFDGIDAWPLRIAPGQRGYQIKAIGKKEIRDAFADDMKALNEELGKIR